MLSGGTHNWSEGAVFLQPSIRCNYKWPRAEGWGSQSDLGSHVNLRPTVSWLWQQDFTSIIQIPKQRQSALCQLQPAGPCLQAGTWSRAAGGGKKRADRVEPSHNEWNPPSRRINRGHNHSLIRVKTRSRCDCSPLLRTAMRTSTSPRSGFLNRLVGVFFLMIMQMLFNGYHGHLHLVYRLDSRWHNFDGAGGSTAPRRKTLFDRAFSQK